MDVHYNGTAAERFHGIAEDIPCRCLHNVLNELGTVAVEPFLLFRAADTFVGDTVAAEFVCADLGFYIGKLSAGWERNEQHPALA